MSCRCMHGGIQDGHVVQELHRAPAVLSPIKWDQHIHHPPQTTRRDGGIPAASLHVRQALEAQLMPARDRPTYLRWRLLLCLILTQSWKLHGRRPPATQSTQLGSREYLPSFPYLPPQHPRSPLMGILWMNCYHPLWKRALRSNRAGRPSQFTILISFLTLPPCLPSSLKCLIEAYLLQQPKSLATSS